MEHSRILTEDATPVRPADDFVPRAPRVPCNVETALIDENGRELIARLGNISVAGFMAECEEKQRKGAIISISLPLRGIVKAEVRWVLGWKFGAMIMPG